MNETDREAGLNLHAPEGDVTVAERRADDPDPDLERLGRVDDDLLEDQRLPGGPAHGGCSPPGRKAVRRLAVGWKKKEGTARGDGCSCSGREESKSLRQRQSSRIHSLGCVPLHRIGLGPWLSMEEDSLA